MKTVHFLTSALVLLLQCPFHLKKKKKRTREEKKAFGNKSEIFPETFLLVKISVVHFNLKSRD